LTFVRGFIYVYSWQCHHVFVVLFLSISAVAFFLVFYKDYDAAYLALSGSLYVVITMVLTVRQASVAAAYTWLLAFGIVFNIVGCLVLVAVVAYIVTESGESNIFTLDKWGRYYWNQLVASVFIIALLDYLAPIAYMQLRDLGHRVKETVRPSHSPSAKYGSQAMHDRSGKSSPLMGPMTNNPSMGLLELSQNKKLHRLSRLSEHEEEQQADIEEGEEKLSSARETKTIAHV